MSCGISIDYNNNNNNIHNNNKHDLSVVSDDFDNSVNFYRDCQLLNNFLGDPR